MAELKQITDTKTMMLFRWLAKLNRFRRFFSFAAGTFLLFWVTFVLELNVVLPVFLLSLAFLYKILSKNTKSKTMSLINLIFLFVIGIGAGNIVIQNGFSFFYIPISIISMLAVILYDDVAVSFLLTLACAITIGVLAKNNFALSILLLISGTVSLILARDSRRRITVIKAGVAGGLVLSGLLFFAYYSVIKYPREYLIAVFNGLACGVIVLGVLPIFEHLFRTITNISLLELADFNHPLLNRIMLEAPGTYHHSLIVGNLADAACKAVGANALLARIGAYYHDIGKLNKPEYFSENQERHSDKHKDLSATISRIIIMNHVKDGVDLAKKYKLNPILIDFIQQHHGNSLVYYFYRRALETQEENQEITEEGFRYPGPKPDTREKAIVLLADSVEATARALKEPTPARFEEVVHRTINNRFIDGQLDECDLTLKDLEKISSVFIRVLTGIYHSRVDYKDNENQSGSTG